MRDGAACAAQAAFRRVSRGVAGGTGLNARARARAPARSKSPTVEDLSHEGRGVAHHAGKVVFIDDALARRASRMDARQARAATSMKAGSSGSSNRRPIAWRHAAHISVCAAVARCSICRPRGRSNSSSASSPIASRASARCVAGEILPPLQANAWNYRRRARLAARWVPKKNRVVVGFRERSTSYIADLQRCEVSAGDPSTAMTARVVVTSDLAQHSQSGAADRSGRRRQCGCAGDPSA